MLFSLSLIIDVLHLTLLAREEEEFCIDCEVHFLGAHPLSGALSQRWFNKVEPNSASILTSVSCPAQLLAIAKTD